MPIPARSPKRPQSATFSDRSLDESLKEFAEKEKTKEEATKPSEHNNAKRFSYPFKTSPKEKALPKLPTEVEDDILVPAVTEPNTPQISLPESSTLKRKSISYDDDHTSFSNPLLNDESVMNAIDSSSPLGIHTRKPSNPRTPRSSQKDPVEVETPQSGSRVVSSSSDKRKSFIPTPERRMSGVVSNKFDDIMLQFDNLQSEIEEQANNERKSNEDKIVSDEEKLLSKIEEENERHRDRAPKPPPHAVRNISATDSAIISRSAPILPSSVDFTDFTSQKNSPSVTRSNTTSTITPKSMARSSITLSGPSNTVSRSSTTSTVSKSTVSRSSTTSTISKSNVSTSNASAPHPILKSSVTNFSTSKSISDPANKRRSQIAATPRVSLEAQDSSPNTRVTSMASSQSGVETITSQTLPAYRISQHSSESSKSQPPYSYATPKTKQQVINDSLATLSGSPHHKKNYSTSSVGVRTPILPSSHRRTASGYSIGDAPQTPLSAYSHKRTPSNSSFSESVRTGADSFVTARSVNIDEDDPPHPFDPMSVSLNKCEDEQFPYDADAPLMKKKPSHSSASNSDASLFESDKSKSKHIKLEDTEDDALYEDLETSHVRPAKSKPARRHSKRSSKNLKGGKKKSIRPFSYDTLARLLNATDGIVIGQEFADLQIPTEEKYLIEKIVDSISRLTANMMLNPNRYDQGCQRLEKVLSALEGFE
ncbi:unnamed protein product [Ambrosiozyma monospora]|uniref:Unnamed protein product n=1 Tax=Ambrosiozyma monospora TaxID=43982 RepID=A0ACB5SVP6_AMBMO|nr:unnamed protein product [Ambrosiozyma monospora]